MTSQFTAEQIEALKAIIHEDQIKDRQAGGGRRLKYIKADMQIDTANRIFGYGQWGYKVVSRGHMVIDDPKKGKIEMYTADVELSVAGAAFSFPGGGVGIVNDPYTVEMHEKAYKEAETDAMKRALRHYGDQFGLSLYNEDDPIEGRDGTIKPVKAAEVRNHQVPQERRIVDAHTSPALPPAQPANHLITPEQIKAYRHFCKLLNREPGPDIESLSQQTAKETIAKLSSQARQKQFSEQASKSA